MNTARDILRFEGVTLKSIPREQTPVRNASFALGPGALLIVMVESGNENLPLADAAEGLLVPDAGVVTWHGRPWTSLGPYDECAARARIGRVFEKNAWISNLTVMENITLSLRHHSKRPESELASVADALASSFGLPEAPRRRPSDVPRRDLKIAEWVRAFIAGPDLLLLERPENGVLSSNLPPLFAAVARARAAGTAIVWQTDREETWNAKGLAGAARCRMRGGEMCFMEETRT